jgi:hypothetical protein
MPEQFEINKETNTANKGNGGFVIDTTFIIHETNNAMVSFVAKVKTHYQTGDTYQDLVTTLDPVNNLNDIQDSGDDLLRQAYLYIVNDVADGNMSGENITIALQEIVVRADAMGVTNLDDVDLEEGSQWLFGLKSGHSALLQRGCSWYQLGWQVLGIG